MTVISNHSSIRSSTARHDRFTIALHWITAFLVLAQFIGAHVWEFLEKGTAPRIVLIMTHFAFGMLLAVVIIVRIGWRLANRNRIPPAVSGLQHVAAQAVHMLLYALLVLQVLLGFAFGWSSGRPLPFFNLFSLSPLVTIDPDWRHTLAELHNDVAWIMIAVVALHTGAALMHHYVLKDRVLLRMMPGK